VISVGNGRVTWQRLQLAALVGVVAALPFYRFGWSLGGQSLAPHEVALLLAAGLTAVGWLARRGKALTPPPPPLHGANIGYTDIPMRRREGETQTFLPPLPRQGEGGWGGEGIPSPTRSRGEGIPSPARSGGEGRSLTRIWTVFDLPIILFLAAALLSLLATEYLRLSLRELRTLILEPLLFWYLCRATLRTATDAAWLVGALLASATVVAIIGLVQLGFGGAVTDVQGVRRVLGTYTSPNHFALLLGRALPFLAALAWSVRRWRAWAIAGGLLCAGALGATFSVGGWLATGLALLVVVGLLGGRRPLLALLAAGLVLAAVVFVAAPTERLSGRLDPRQGTSFVRVQLWQAAGQLVAESPLFGIGLDNFLYRYPALMAAGTPFEPNLSHPHNLILQFWLQLGLAGVVALGWLLWQFGRLTWPAASVKNRSQVDRALAVGALGSMTDFVAHGLVDNSYFLPDMSVIFWLLVAVAVTLHAPRPEVPAADRP
jgi:O-antigen ligase